MFEDVLGRRKYLPFEFFQHYSVFTTFLQESFNGIPGQRYVMNRQYQLMDARNNIIENKTWRQLVGRRSQVKMLVILDAVDDVFVDGMGCPRCSTSAPFAKPNMDVQWYEITL